MASRRDQIRMSDDELSAFLDEQRVVQVCTTGTSGRPHLMPLWYVVEDGPVLRGWTFAKSQKAKNLERDPRATLGIDDGVQYHELRGVMFECDVELERDPERLAALGESIFKRYGDGSDLPDEAREMVRKQAEKRVGLTFTPTKTVTWDHRKLGGVYKGLILSGGKGTRLRPLTHTSAKQLVPVANQPVLFYGIEAMAEAGIEEVGIIVAPETGDEIREAAGDGSQFGVSITYIDQAEPLGLAHAVLTAEPFIGDSPFVMYLGDNLLRNGITDLVRTFESEAPDALILLTKVPDPENYGVAELDGDGRVSRLVEKPAEPATDLALVGVYMFTAGIFDAAKAIEPSPRGELEITDAIQHLVDTGLRVDPHVVQGWWKDTGQVADMLEANRLILDAMEERLDGEITDCQIEGRVVVEAGAVLERATVRGPAVIGAGAVIRDAYIGPYTAIAENVTIEHAELEHSIVLSGSTIRDLDARVEASLIGKNAVVARSPTVPKAHRFVIGDNSEVQIL